MRLACNVIVKTGNKMPFMEATRSKCLRTGAGLETVSGGSGPGGPWADMQLDLSRYFSKCFDRCLQFCTIE